MKKIPGLMISCVITAAAVAIGVVAQQPQSQEPQHRSLWIAKFTCNSKAALAVAATQADDSNALKYSNLFDGVTTFDTDSTEPKGTWSLTTDEVDFSGGSTATRALIGLGAGRAHIEMVYRLTDPSGKMVWTMKIKTKPSFWGSSGGFGAVQNQGAVVGEQAQKLIEALSKFFSAVPPEKKKS